MFLRSLAVVLLCSSSIASAEEKPAETKPKVAPKAEAKKPPRAITITMRDGMRFDPPRFEAKPGEEISINLENADSTHQSHNFVVTKPGQREAIVQQALALGEKGPAADFVPAADAVIAHSGLLTAEKKGTIQFTVPATKGVYPYVCSFPGHGMIMYGAMYVDEPMPPLDKDPNLPPTAVQATLVGGGKRPFVQRMFLPGASPAAIAVALPDEQNVCWDAAQCRLRYAWKGGDFIDATAYWRGNGRDLAEVKGAIWWSAPKESFPFRLGAPDSVAPVVKFLGYRLEQGFPEFHYTMNGVEVREKVTGSASAVVLRFRLTKPSTPITFQGTHDKGKWTSDVGEWKDDALSLTPEQAAEFTLTLTAL